MLAALRREHDQITEAILSLERLAVGHQRRRPTTSMDGHCSKRESGTGEKMRSPTRHQKRCEEIVRSAARSPVALVHATSTGRKAV